MRSQGDACSNLGTKVALTLERLESTAFVRVPLVTSMERQVRITYSPRVKQFQVSFKFTSMNRWRMVGFFSPFFPPLCLRGKCQTVIYELLQILDFCMTSSPRKCLVGRRGIAGTGIFQSSNSHSWTLLIWLCRGQPGGSLRVNVGRVLWHRWAGCVLSSL